MTPKAAIMLDFDGTVVDTMEIYADWVASALHDRLGLDRSFTRKKYLELAGRPFIEQLRIIGVKEDTAELISRDFTKFKEGLLRNLELNGCVRQFLKELRERGLLTVLSTNNECDSIKSSPLILDFHLVLCFDGKTHRKGKEHLNTLRTLFGEELRVVFVGDSEYDIQTYSQLGVPSIKTRGLFDCGESERVLNLIDSALFGK